MNILYHRAEASKWNINDLIEKLERDDRLEKEVCCWYDEDGKIASDAWEGDETSCGNNSSFDGTPFGTFHTHPLMTKDGRNCEWFSDKDILYFFKIGFEETSLYNVESGKLFTLRKADLERDGMYNPWMVACDGEWQVALLKKKYYESSIVT